MTKPENIYEQVFNLSGDAFVLVDQKERIRLVNKKAAELYEYDKSEMIGMKVQKLIHHDHKHEFVRFAKEISEHGSFITSSKDLKKDGTIFHSEIKGNLVFFENEPMFLAIVRDISDRVSINKRLSASEDNYKLLAENIQDVIWTLTPDLKVSYVSPSIEKMRGFTAEEVMEQTLEELVLPHSIEIVRHLINSFFVSLEQGTLDKEAKTIEIEQLCKDGSTIWAEVLVTPYFDENDNFIFFLGVSRNITERIADRKEKEQLQKQLQIQWQKMPIGFVIWDKNSKVMSWNPSAEKIFGYTEEEMIGKKPFDQLVPKDFHFELDRIWKELHEDEKTIHNINQNITKNRGIITCKWSNTPLKGEGGELIGVLSMIQDITKEQKNERELKLHRENLEEIVKKRTEELERQAKKLHDSQIALTFLLEDTNETRLDLEAANSKLDAVNKELEAFSYSVSHDLRAPLNRMDGFSKALLEDYSESLGARGIHYLNRIRASSKHMTNLINNILDLSRISTREIIKKEINISAMISKIVNELTESSPGRKVNFKVQKKMFLKADKTLMEIILRNLLENAWKFTKDKDLAEISCGMKVIDNQNVLFIKDNGVGFNMKYYDQLFKPFRRLHSERDFTGTGIGLATVLRIVNRHKGKIWAESEINVGTTFNIVL